MHRELKNALAQASADHDYGELSGEALARIEALEAALRPFAALIHRPWETHGSCHQAVSYDDVVRAAELLKLEV